jgi:hypothetical protein
MGRFDYKRPGEERLLEGGGSGGGYRTRNEKIDIKDIAPAAAGAAVAAGYYPASMYVSNKRNAAEREAQAEIKRESRGKELQANSYAQYQHEREAGDPNALRLSFTEWKSLD